MMLQAYSRLKRLLDEHNMSIPELHRRLVQRGTRVNLKSLYRLSNDQYPLQRLDLRVAGAICYLYDVRLSELITFEEDGDLLSHLSVTKQKRLDALMAKNNAGHLTNAEREALQRLVREAEEITLRNARVLASQRRQLVTD